MRRGRRPSCGVFRVRFTGLRTLTALPSSEILLSCLIGKGEAVGPAPFKSNRGTPTTYSGNGAASPTGGGTGGQMATNSTIEWTEMTWNPVTGCTKVSDGCRHCYAERMALRLRAMGNRRYVNGFEVTLHDDLVELPRRLRQSRMIFVNSMNGRPCPRSDCHGWRSPGATVPPGRWRRASTPRQASVSDAAVLV
jgi:hypothetical protein